MRLLASEPFLSGAEFMSKLVCDIPEASTGLRRRGFFASSPVSEAERWLICLVWCFIAQVIGCGGGSTSQTPPAKPVVQQPATDSRSVGFAQRVEKKVDNSVDLTGVAPDDIFDLATSPPPNFVVSGSAPPSRPEDQFVAVVDPTAGSSVFQVTTSPEPSGNASTSVNSNTPSALPPGFTAISGTPIVDGLPSRIICQADQSEMILIPAGTSVIGAKDGPSDCIPEVPVSLDAFYISMLEVNVGQYGEFRSRSIKAGSPVEKCINVDAASDYPALGVAWVEARAYAKSTSRELPTECQWEKAARGPQGLSAPWGNGRPLWNVPREPGQIDPCGTFADDRSIFGVFDMAGNAQEWLLDFYDAANHEELAVMDDARRKNWAGPRRASETGQRVVKGDGPEWAVWFRRGLRMTERNPNVGFRCVLNLMGAP